MTRRRSLLIAKPTPESLFEHLKSCLLDHARLHEDVDTYLHPLVHSLNEWGLSIAGASVVLRTKHPQLEMLVQRWHPTTSKEVSVDDVRTIVQHYANQKADGTTEVYLLKHGHSNQALYLKSPFAAVEVSGKAESWILNEHMNPPAFPIFPDLVTRGHTEYCVVPVPMPAPYSFMISLSTKAPGGFPDDFLETMIKTVPYIRLSVAHKVERIMMTELLAAYLGRNTAKQVASGRIRHGDLQSLQAVIGFVDLRGFTALTERLNSDQLLALMGSFYSSIDRSVTKYGGEILKFIGDGLLFVFPAHEDATNICQSAVDALQELQMRIHKANKKYPETPIRYAAALHEGHVRYGNIGAPKRLDFTVIGAAVNQTVRLQELGSDHDLTLILSRSVADPIEQPTELLGSFQLTGFKDHLMAYTLKGSMDHD